VPLLGCRQRRMAREVLTGLSDEQRAALFGGTAKRLFGG
jgi:hypothetical protein